MDRVIIWYISGHNPWTITVHNVLTRLAKEHLPKKFADDVVDVSVGSCRSDIEKERQQAVNNLTTWSKKWAMNVNVSKTKAIVFGDCVSSVKLLINNIPIEQVTSYKYLRSGP